MKLLNENETIKQALNSDGAALARIATHLQQIVNNYANHSTREIAENHAHIEAKRLSIIALTFVSAEKVEVFDLLQIEMIKQS